MVKFGTYIVNFTNQWLTLLVNVDPTIESKHGEHGYTVNSNG